MLLFTYGQIMPAYAQDAVNDGGEAYGGAGTDAQDGFYFDATSIDDTATVAAGENVGDNTANGIYLDTGISSGGTVTFLGSSNVTGGIGTTSQQITTVNNTNTGGVDVISVIGDLNIGTLNLDGDGGGGGDAFYMAGVNPNAHITTANIDDCDFSVQSTTMTMTIGTLNLIDTGTAEFGGTVTVGSIVPDADGDGTVVCQGPTTITGDIGTDTKDLNRLYLGIDGNPNSVGDVVVSGDIYADLVRIEDLRMVVGKSTLAVTNTANNVQVLLNDDATIDLRANTLDIDNGGAGRFISGGNATIETTINSATEYGNIDCPGNATVDATDSLAVTVNGYVPNGTVFTIVDGTGGGGVGDLAAAISDNSALLSFAQDTTDDDDLDIIATRTSLNTVTTPGSGTIAGNALETDAAGGNMTTTMGEIDSLTSTAQIVRATNELAPNTNEGAILASKNVVTQNALLISDRLAATRGAGVATGDEFTENNIWAKGFGTIADQDDRGSEQGYDLGTIGFGVGMDTNVSEQVSLGLAFSYGYSIVDFDASNLGDTSIDSYQGSIYGDYEDGSFYVDGLFAFGMNQYEAGRTITVGGTSYGAVSDYWGQQYTGYLECGYDITRDDLTVTPIASLNYTHLHINDYDEAGAGEKCLAVDDQDYDIFETGLGFKIAHLFTTEDLNITPDIHGMWYWDMVGDQVDVTARYGGGATSFNTEGNDPAQHRFRIGASVSLLAQENIEVIVGYDLDLKDDYYGHNATIELKYAF